MHFIATLLLVLIPYATGRFDDPDPVKPCSMQSCFNVTRCAKSFSLYLYQTPSGQERPFCYKCMGGPCQRFWYQACFMYTLMSSGFQITDNADEACLLVTPYDLCPANFCDQKKMDKIESDLRSLPHWNDGKNHFVWNFWNDWPSTGFDVGKSIVVSASFIDQTYRRFYDVALPLSRINFREPEPPVLRMGWALREMGVMERLTKGTELLKSFARSKDLLLYFRGSIPAMRRGVCEHRSRIFGRLFVPPTNISDVHIEATCLHNHTDRPAHLRVSHCDGCINNRRTKANGDTESCTAAWPSMSFDEGLARAKFAFAPRGCGSQSFRLLEAIGFGAVPVISGWGSFPPFDNEAVIGRLYHQCVLQVAEEQLGSLIMSLRNMSDQEYYTRLQACVQIATYEGHSMKVLVQQSVCIIAARVAAALGSRAEALWNSGQLHRRCVDVGVFGGQA